MTITYYNTNDAATSMNMTDRTCPSGLPVIGGELVSSTRRFRRGLRTLHSVECC